MKIAYFLTWWRAAGAHDEAAAADLARVTDVVRTTPGVTRALVFTPDEARDPYLKDEATPALAAELYFDDLAALERAAARAGHLQVLAAPQALPSLAACSVEQQATLVRPTPVPDPVIRTPGGETCSYLVGYDGPADDLNAWLAHYIDEHPAIMTRFPGIREIEVCTRIDWYGFLPWRRDRCMLRNKVVFDSSAALAAALASPVRHEMRADYHRFPPFRGGVFHVPMRTREVAG